MVTRKAAATLRTASSRRNGSPVRNGSLASQRFERQADHILKQYETMGKKVLGRRAFSRPENYLKRECYNLIFRHTKWSGRTIIEVVRRWRCVPDTITYKQNRFYWGLLAIDPQEEFIRDPALSKYAKEMLYAAKHGVPAEYLIGFLMQSDNLASIREKLQSGELDREFMSFRRRAKSPP